MSREPRPSPIPAAAAVFVTLLAAGCSAAPAGPQGSEAVPVTTSVAIQKDVPVVIQAIGTVESTTTVEVRAQIGGTLETIAFHEGQDVRQGDLLFRLDARPYQAALQSAEATLARDRAQLKTAEADAKRYDDLVAKEYVTREEYDRIETTAATLAATVKADEAAADNARVQLGYCSIRSPIDGRTGQLMVHQGNLVKANSDLPLLTINRLVPIYVAFSVPEQHLSEIRARRAQGALEVGAAIPDSGLSPATGELTFLDNTVDRTTGTVRLKATFANRDRALWPGQFVDVRLTVSTRAGAVVVPSQALQTGQQGPFVFVVKPDATVESRPVKTAGADAGETVVDTGLRAGETVVTDGQLRLVPGTHVLVKNDAAAVPAPASGTPAPTPAPTPGPAVVPAGGRPAAGDAARAGGTGRP